MQFKCFSSIKDWRSERFEPIEDEYQTIWATTKTLTFAYIQIGLVFNLFFSNFIRNQTWFSKWFLNFKLFKGRCNLSVLVRLKTGDRTSWTNQWGMTNKLGYN